MWRASIAITIVALLGTWPPVAAASHQPETATAEGLSGEPWPTRTLKGAQDIAAGGDRFVVVGTGGKRDPHAKVWTSSDGQTWTRSPDDTSLRDAGMDKVVATDEGFVALGSDRQNQLVAWHSADGVTWERGSVQRPGKGGFEIGLRDVVDGPGGLLALGIFIGQDLAGHRLWRSQDGRDWESVPTPAPRDAIVEGLAAVPDGYLLLANEWPGERSGIWRSSDGTEWRPVEGSPWLRDLASTDDGAVVGGGFVDLWATGDLETWAQTWASPDPENTQGETLTVEADGSLAAAYLYLYAACDDGGECVETHLLFSDEGAPWVGSDGPDGIPGNEVPFLIGIASLGDLHVMLGIEGEDTRAWLLPSTS